MRDFNERLSCSVVGLRWLLEVEFCSELQCEDFEVLSALVKIIWFCFEYFCCMSNFNESSFCSVIGLRGVLEVNLCSEFWCMFNFHMFTTVFDNVVVVREVRSFQTYTFLFVVQRSSPKFRSD